jgi:proliferating cell nuclear antigen
MFEARLVQGGLLRKVLDAVKDLVQDANLECEAGGIAVQALDTSHNAIIAVFLESGGFEAYSHDADLTLGVSLSNLSKILKCGNADDAITLRGEPGSDTLRIGFDGHTAERVSAYQVRLMDINAEVVNIPEIEFSTTVRMPSAEFQRLCKDFATIGENVTLSATPADNTFTLSTSGDIGGAEVICSSTSDGLVPTIIDCAADFKHSFSLKFLNAFTKATPLSPYVTLYMLAGMPILVAYEIVGIGYVRYYLSPKIDEDDD